MHLFPLKKIGGGGRLVEIIDLFTIMAAILNEFDFMSIIGCPGGMNTFRLYFRAFFGTFFL